MSIQRLQHFTRWPIERNRVRHRSETVEVVPALLACCKPASQVHVWLIWILLLIQSIGSRVPNIDDSAFDGFASLEIRDCAVHPCTISLFLDARHNAASHLHLRSIVAVEGA